MIEVCFCGWQGAVDDRKYHRTAEGIEGLACPNCGHIDYLDYLPESYRNAMLATARQRQASFRYTTSPLRLRTSHPAA